MNLGFDWIKSHKGLSAGIAGAIFLVTYLLSKSKSSSGTASSGTYGLSPNDLSFLQIQAGTQQTAINANAQTSIAQIQSNTAIAGINASQEVTDNQTAAQLAATQYGYNAATQIVNTQAGVQMAGINAETGVYGEVINAQQQEEENQQNLASSELSYVNSVNGSQNRVALLQSIIGQPQAAAATETSEGQIQSQPSAFASILSSVAGIFTGSLTGGLFGAKPATPVTYGSVPTQAQPLTNTIAYAPLQNYTTEITPTYGSL